MIEQMKSKHHNGELNDPLWIRVLTFICKGLFFKDDSKPGNPVEEALVYEEDSSSVTGNREDGLRKNEADERSSLSKGYKDEKQGRNSDSLSTLQILLLLTYPIWGVVVGFALVGFFAKLNLLIIGHLIVITVAFTMPISMAPIWVIKIPIPVKIIISIAYIIVMAVPVFAVGWMSACFFDPHCH